ncbi:MAG: 3-dehydroquinate synthase [Sediminispirochaetaceae bacterium]
MREFFVALPQRHTEVLFFPQITAAALTVDSSAALIICDTNTEPLFPDKPYPHYTISPGERYKSWETLNDLASWAITEGAGRDVTFIGVGGGVVCDVTAFLASIYMRGTELVLLPTTLLAMVDAALGGKTGIDFEGYKNILGSFYPAGEVRIVPDILSTLPDREYRSGLAEVIKHGLLLDTDLYDLLKDKRKEVLSRDPDTTAELIYRSMQVKKNYIEKDPFERDVRGYLNLGHTFAHALESEGKLSAWTHGEAVAWGIDKAMKAGVLLGLTDREYAGAVRALLLEYGYNLDIKLTDIDSLMDAMQQDKKKRSGRVRFILQQRQGQTQYAEIPEAIIRRALEE